MIASASNRSKRHLPRSGMLFGLGVRLTLSGSILVVMYFFLVAQSPLQDLRETLSWAVPAGFVCWMLAVGFFAAGLVAWNSEDENPSELSVTRSSLNEELGPTGNPSFRDSVRDLELAVKRRLPSLFHLEWSLPLLRSLDGEAFRQLGASFFREIGFRPVATVPWGSRSVDIWLYGEEEVRAVGAVQCLPWGSDLVGGKQVRDFYGAMTADKIENGVILTTGSFTGEAVNYALGKKLELISGEAFLAKLASLPADKSEALLREAMG